MQDATGFPGAAHWGWGGGHADQLAVLPNLPRLPPLLAGASTPIRREVQQNNDSIVWGRRVGVGASDALDWAEWLGARVTATAMGSAIATF